MEPNDSRGSLPEAFGQGEGCHNPHRVELEKVSADLIEFARNRIADMDSLIIRAKRGDGCYPNLCYFLHWVLESSYEKGLGVKETAERLAGAFRALMFCHQSKTFLRWQEIFCRWKKFNDDRALLAKSHPVCSENGTPKSLNGFGRLISCLPEAGQAILTLRYQEEYSMARIGELLGIVEKEVSLMHDEAVQVINKRFSVDFVAQVRKGFNGKHS